jgi:hypothetical protein
LKALGPEKAWPIVSELESEVEVEVEVEVRGGLLRRLLCRRSIAGVERAKHYLYVERRWLGWAGLCCPAVFLLAIVKINSNLQNPINRPRKIPNKKNKVYNIRLFDLRFFLSQHQRIRDVKRERGKSNNHKTYERLRRLF